MITKNEPDSNKTKTVPAAAKNTTPLFLNAREYSSLVTLKIVINGGYNANFLHHLNRISAQESVKDQGISRCFCV